MWQHFLFRSIAWPLSTLYLIFAELLPSQPSVGAASIVVQAHSRMPCKPIQCLQGQHPGRSCRRWALQSSKGLNKGEVVRCSLAAAR